MLALSSVTISVNVSPRPWMFTLLIVPVTVISPPGVIWETGSTEAAEKIPIRLLASVPPRHSTVSPAPVTSYTMPPALLIDCVLSNRTGNSAVPPVKWAFSHRLAW